MEVSVNAVYLCKSENVLHSPLIFKSHPTEPKFPCGDGDLDDIFVKGLDASCIESLVLN